MHASFLLCSSLFSLNELAVMCERITSSNDRYCGPDLARVVRASGLVRFGDMMAERYTTATKSGVLMMLDDDHVYCAGSLNSTGGNFSTNVTVRDPFAADPTTVTTITTSVSKVLGRITSDRGKGWIRKAHLFCNLGVKDTDQLYMYKKGGACSSSSLVDVFAFDCW
jgi:hypothetical protein